LNIKLRKDIGDKMLVALKETATELNEYTRKILDGGDFENVKQNISIEELEERINELKIIQGGIFVLDLMEDDPESFFMEVENKMKRYNVEEMSSSYKCFELIKQFEALKLEAYKCSANFETIGWGTTVYGDTGKKVKLGDKITKERADKLFKIDILKFENYVKKYVKVPLKQDEFDALVSFFYNLGPTKVKNSTLIKELNNANYESAAAQFKWWRSKGTPSEKGLTRRRFSERDLYLGKKEYIHPKYEEWMKEAYL
jgi:lysozyme